MCQDEALDDHSLHPYPTWSVIVCECVHGVCACLCTCSCVCAGTHTMASVPRTKDNLRSWSSPFTLRETLCFSSVNTDHTSWLEIRGLSYLSLPLATQAQELQPCASKPGFVWVPDPSACAANTAPLSLLTTSSSIRVNGSKEFNLFTNTVGCGSARF